MGDIFTMIFFFVQLNFKANRYSIYVVKVFFVGKTIFVPRDWSANNAKTKLIVNGRLGSCPEALELIT